MTGPRYPSDPNRYYDSDLPDDEEDQDEIQSQRDEYDNYLADYADDSGEYPASDHPNY